MVQVLIVVVTRIVATDLTWLHAAGGVYATVAPVAYQVILEPGIGQFREFEPRRVHTRIIINKFVGTFLVHKLTCGMHESVR